MNKDNVVDIRTRQALFTGCVRDQLEDGIKPFLKDGSSDDDRARAVTTVEQVLCAAIVSAAVALATNLANKIAGKITTVTP